MIMMFILINHYLMKNTIGFLFTAVKPVLPINRIISTASNYQTYLINQSIPNLVDFYADILNQLNSDQWESTKYDVLDNLCFFNDEQRVQQCDLIIIIDEAGGMRVEGSD